MPDATTQDIDTLHSRLTALIVGIAPDIDAGSIDPRVSLRDQFEFDSMDTLHLAAAISHEFGVDVPESDYAQLASLEASCDYLRRRLDAASG